MSIPFHTDLSSKRGNTHGEYKQKRGRLPVPFSIFIMSFARNNIDYFVFLIVNNSVGIINTPTPHTA